MHANYSALKFYFCGTNIRSKPSATVNPARCVGNNSDRQDLRVRFNTRTLFLCSVANQNAGTILARECLFGPKCWDVVTGEFVGGCQTLDKLIKELLADGFADGGWHSLAAQSCTAPTIRRCFGSSNVLDIDPERLLHA